MDYVIPTGEARRAMQTRAFAAYQQILADEQGDEIVVVSHGGSLYWAWAFATCHILGMAVCFWLRFRTGKWKAMRVIEPEVV